MPGVKKKGATPGLKENKMEGLKSHVFVPGNIMELEIPGYLRMIIRLQSPFVLVPAALVLSWLVMGFTYSVTAIILGGIFLCLFFSYLIKVLVKRPRPGRISFYGFLDVYGFPSIHAANTAMVSTYITIHGSWLAVLAWILFFIVCWSRWKSKLHYLGDLVGGMVIGIAAAFGLTTLTI